MNNRLIKLLTVMAVVLAAMGGTIYYKTHFPPSLSYPYLVIDAPHNIRIEILQKGLQDPSACTRSLASAETALIGACRACQITASECKTDLDSTEKLWLSDRPIAIPSAKMASGVIVFEATEPQIALSACQETSKQSLANKPGAGVTCFPAGIKRSSFATEQQILRGDDIKSQNGLLVTAALIFVSTLIIVLILALLQKFSTRDPSEPVTAESTSYQRRIKISNLVKRVLDLSIAIILLLTLLPILLTVAALIWILEGTPIFYISHRYTEADSTAVIYKFRTMVRDATSSKYRLRERFMRDGYLDIPLDCEVYTPIGRILEKTQIVETLQLLNVIFDNMSFVGNRPLPKENVDLLSKFPNWKLRFESPAGITGISQIVGKHNLLPEDRIELESAYSYIYKSNKGNILICDAFIVFYTIRLITTGKSITKERAFQLLSSSNFGAIPA